MYKNYAMWKQEGAVIDSLLDGLSTDIQSGSAGHIDDHKKISQFLVGVRSDADVMFHYPSHTLIKSSDGWTYNSQAMNQDLVPLYINQAGRAAIVQDDLSEPMEYPSIDDIPVGSQVKVSLFAEGANALLKTVHANMTSQTLLISTLSSKVSTLESDNATLQSTIADLTSRLEALEISTNPE